MYPKKLRKNLSSIFLVISCVLCKTTSENVSLTFPDDFLLGTAISSHQVEGAWNIDGKGESVWNHFEHNYPGDIEDGSNADASCDFYHKYKEDIKLVKSFGFNHFRFSISWPRIFPDGLTSEPNPKGVLFYHKILDELEKHGIIPFMTMYHLDHPQYMEKFGSWTNSYMAYVFADYARFIFQEYSSRVKLFLTINEPQLVCSYAYGQSLLAPAKNLSDIGMYLCVQNMLKAHALAYHIYNEEFRSEQGGKVGIVMQCSYFYAKNHSDYKISNIAFEFECGWAAHPIFSKSGDYPPIMKQIIQKRSALKGLSRSELPTLSDKWIKLIKGSSDFFGLNHYASHLVETNPADQKRGWLSSETYTYTHDPTWQPTAFPLFYVVPRGFGDVLRKIKEEYGNPEIYILECGVADSTGINDYLRSKFLYSYIKEMLIAMKRDKCNVKAFTIWSFLDSYEWIFGYILKFGLVQVDFNNVNLTRTLKNSASWLKTMINTRRLEYPTK